MKILAFAGSSSTDSINKKLVSYVTSLFGESVIEILDLNDFEMPLFSVDKEKQNGIPQLAFDFANKIDSCDLILMSLAEHNGSYTVAFKNIFDWISRINSKKAFGNKPIMLMATSTGVRGGASVLEIAKNRFPFNGGKIITTFSLPSFSSNFDELIGIKDEKMKAELVEKIEIVKQTFYNKS